MIHPHQGDGGHARWRATVLVSALLLPGAIAQTQQQEPSHGLTIVSPPDGSYVSGPFVLQARITAGSPPRQVTFFADGRSVCTLVAPPFECAWDAGAAIKEHVIRVTATLANGQRLVATSRTKSAGYTETVDVEVVQVTTTVTDPSGVFVQGLTRDQFRVREDGVLQKLTAFAGENIPLELVVAVDVSESMTNAMPTLKAAVKGFLGALRPADEVGLLAFNDNIFTLARRSIDPQVRLKAVDRLLPGAAPPYMMRSLPHSASSANSRDGVRSSSSPMARIATASRRSSALRRGSKRATRRFTPSASAAASPTLSWRPASSRSRQPAAGVPSSSAL